MKKNKWLSLLRFMVQAGLLLGLTYLAGEMLSLHVIKLRFRWDTEGLVALGIALILGSWMLYRLLAHIGWLVFSLCSGYSLAEYSVLGVGLHRGQDGRLRPGFRRMVDRYVLVLLSPPRLDGMSRWRPSLLGGPILMASAAVVFGVLTAVLGCRPPEMTLLAWITSNRAYAAFLAMPCIWGIVTLVGKCIPDGTGSDLPSRLKRYAAFPELRRAREQLMYLSARARAGFITTENPEECYAPCPPELLVWPEAFAAAVLRSTWLLSAGRYVEAYELMCLLLAQPSEAHWERYMLTCNAALCEAILGREPEHVPMLEDPTLQLFVGGHMTLLVRAQYAAALLVHRDAEKAAAALAAYDERMARLGEKSREIDEMHRRVIRLLGEMQMNGGRVHEQEA